ncbi:glycerol kinase [Hyphomicrobium sp. 1Nfss2.1]|uniref:glycerol kinase GlpK n=1 Tax=Hyphomicrobium sp. 1Nfss2.1 TaxID=3413936 RepID=UPI003C7E0BE2
MGRYVLAIDQGTTSSRALLFDEKCHVRSVSQQEFTQHFPYSGWVEHDAEEIWRSVLDTAREAVTKAGGPTQIVGIGISNQRETTVVWERASGRPIYKAIVWQDRRTAEVCEALRAAGHEALVTQRTGLLLDPYFSSTKIAWILDHVPGARARAERGELAFGTIDCFLLWRLTGGRVHATDATNAARTCLFDIRKGAWDEDLLRIFGVPGAMLPEVRDNAAEFGETDGHIFGAPICVRGMAGDQQAATIGQACFKPGMLKSTYGTGCFAVLNTGDDCIASRHRLLSTIAYQIDGRRTYALEGSIFIAGAAVQWLRDGLKIVRHASETGRMASQADPGQEVVLVPAFVGLGAPYWDPDCRGAMFGLTRNAGPNEFARGALQAVCFQTLDLLTAMRGDWPAQNGTVLRADGGMAACDWTMQRLADILDVPVDRPTVVETTALGAAYLAGLQAGFYPQLEEFAAMWALDRRFQPGMAQAERAGLIASWHDAVRRTLTQREG